jgi:hypothetical protein
MRNDLRQELIRDWDFAAALLLSTALVNRDGHGADGSLAECRHCTLILVAAALTSLRSYWTLRFWILAGGNRTRRESQFRGLCAFHWSLVAKFVVYFKVNPPDHPRPHDITLSSGVSILRVERGLLF